MKQEEPHPYDFEDKPSRLTKEDTQFIAKEAVKGSLKSLLIVPIGYILVKIIALVFDLILPS